MKKNNLFQKLVIVVFTALTMFSCQKKDEAPGTAGSFIVDATTYSGTCTAVNSTSCTNGKDVGIAPSTGTPTFLVYNMPSASTGTFNFVNGATAVGTCNLWGGFVLSVQNVLVTRSGTLTKTGANSFTFSCIVYDIATNSNKTITGNGNY